MSAPSLLPSARVATSDEQAVTTRLRAGLLVLAGLGVVGTATELAIIRHWESAEQLIPWVVLAVVGGGIALVAWRPRRLSIRAAQLIGLATLAGGAYGVVEHVSSNLSAGPLDATYGPRWDSMSTVSRWWAAATGGVGPSPTLAPGVLAMIGLCLLLATWAHPALGDGPT